MAISEFPSAGPLSLRSNRQTARGVAVLRDLVALTKPRITGLVLWTWATGMVLAPGEASMGTRALSLIGTLLIVGSANALNMWWERDVDARMERTRDRPLPAGRLSPEVALTFGVLLGVASLPCLACVNLTTVLLGLAALISYVAVYTPLKRYSYLALLVGAVPGAMPPLLGWSSVTGSLGLGGVLLFVFLFLWQIPHFAAITIFRAEDYARAGLKVVAVQHGERAARRMIALWTGLLVGSSFAFAVVGMAGRVYDLAALGLGAVFLVLSFRAPASQATVDSRRWARRVFAFSILYLTVLLLVLVADRARV